MSTFYFTTAIPYPNGRPHIGHAFEMIAADAMARYQRLRGVDTFLLGGLDENSQNVARAAAARGIPPLEFTDEMAEVFMSTWSSVDVNFDDFVRTTQPRHHRSVTEFFKRVEANGDIYAGTYEGWYCVSCEAFYPEEELVDGSCPVHKSKPEWLSESNYFFRLSKYQEALLDLYASQPDFVTPETRRNEVVSFVKHGLRDLSISRATVKWGIPLPTDPDQSIYVWFDALINYVTGIGFGQPGREQMFGELWPAQAHVIGKDIIRFHAVYWPAMLMSAGIELPRQIVTHGFVNFGGEKLSKSRGIVVYPNEVIEIYGSDALRYYLLREVPFDRDGDFTWESMNRRYHADLANDLGNLVLRTTSMVSRYFNGAMPEITGSNVLEADLHSTSAIAWDRAEQHFDAWRFHQGLASIWDFVTGVNQYIERNEPWQLAKDAALRGRLQTVLGTCVEAVRQIAILIRPTMPRTSDATFAHLGVPPVALGAWSEGRVWSTIPAGQRVPGGPALFPRIETT